MKQTYYNTKAGQGLGNSSSQIDRTQYNAWKRIKENQTRSRLMGYSVLLMNEREMLDLNIII